MDLRTLGLKVLKLEDFTVEAAVTDNRRIQEAAFDVLNTWRRGQGTGQEAYRALRASLLEVGWKQLATELQQWVEKTTPISGPTPSRKSQLLIVLQVPVNWFSSVIYNPFGSFFSVSLTVHRQNRPSVSRKRADILLYFCRTAENKRVAQAILERQALLSLGDQGLDNNTQEN